MIAQKRGKSVALGGGGAQLLFAGVMLVIWLYTDSLSAMSSLILLAVGIPLWAMVGLMFYCRELERRETDELEKLAAAGGPGGTIFEKDQDQELRPAAARVAFVERWMVPVFTLLWAGLHVTVGVLLIRYLTARGESSIANPGQGILLSLVIGFAGFLLARYSTGMGKVDQWRWLRATGSYLLVNVLFIAAVLASLILARQDNMRGDLIVAYCGPLVQLVLAAELLLNFILDLYRPRIPGQEHRASFDSRLLNIVAEPGKLGHSIADALNYQFGFEVSKTWFYQLVARAALPLIAFAVLVLVGMSSIVVVPEGEQCVVQHLGRRDRILHPGLRLKWPWPIDTARRFRTDEVHEILLGVGEEIEPTIIKGREIYLWTQEHGRRRELDFVLAVPPRSVESDESPEQRPPPPVNLIKLVAAVQYVISDPYKFGYEFVDSAKELECIAYREMSRYCASATLDSAVPGDDPGRPEAMMTYGRRRVAAELKRRIQARCDELGLGVKIEYVGLPAVHPPAEAAEAYEAVLEAERGKLLTRYEAQAEANGILVKVAGSPLTALRLSLAIRALEELEALRDNPGRFEAMLTDLMRSIEDEIKALEFEIEQERLLGQIHPGSERTDTQELREDYVRHLNLLKRIRSDPKRFDLTSAIADASRTADELFARASGEPAEMVAHAQADRSRAELTEMARAQAFQSAILAYDASPNMYMMDRWLDVWDEVLPGITKYVIGVDRDRLEVWLNWETQVETLEGATFEEEDAQ